MTTFGVGIMMRSIGSRKNVMDKDDENFEEESYEINSNEEPYDENFEESNEIKEYIAKSKDEDEKEKKRQLSILFLTNPVKD